MTAPDVNPGSSSTPEPAEGATDHTIVEPVGGHLVDETRHDPDDVDDSTNAGRDA